MNADTIFIFLCIAVTAIIIVYYLKREKKLIYVLTGALTGSAALFIINRYGTVFSLEINLNLFNIIGSVILGVPFVVFLVIMNFL